MKPTVYIETTIPSYLTAWRSSELQMAANQQATRAWWDNERQHFVLLYAIGTNGFGVENVQRSYC